MHPRKVDFYNLREHASEFNTVVGSEVQWSLASETYTNALELLCKQMPKHPPVRKKIAR